MGLKIKFNALIKTASHSSPHSNNEAKKSPQSSKDFPSRGTESQHMLRLSDGFCNKLQIDLGYLIRDTLNLDPQKTLQQNQRAIKTKDVQANGAISDTSNVNPDKSEAQRIAVENENGQDKNRCCPSPCIIF